MHADLAASALLDALPGWALTYLLHSTLLLGGAWLLVRLWRGMPLALQESLWRAALFGGVLTASAQLALGWVPFGGRLGVPGHGAPDAPAAAVAPLAPRALVLDEASAVASVAAPTGPVPASPRGPDPFVWFAAAWGFGLAILVVRALRARAGLRGRLARRTPLVDGPLPGLLEALRRRARVRRDVRLSQVADLASPVAFGVWRAEIAVPARVARELSPGQQEAMLAHELAHHVRRDPLWLVLRRFAAALLFFQPLGLLAQRHLAEASELQCDAWAAGQTGRGHELAECLTVVAGWMLRDRAPLAVPAMAATGSMLERRVERLVEARPGTSRRRGAGWLAWLPLLAVGALAPAVVDAAAPLAGVEATLPNPVGSADPAEALQMLERETEALRAELAQLLDLLARVEDPPAALTRAVASLAARLEALTRRRDALTRAAKEMER